jgi:hypothetical protein
MSQALLHGVSIIGYNSSTRLIELTKLRVKAPLTLLEFKDSKNQVRYAKNKGMGNFKTFGADDIKIIKHICKNVPSLDGYRALWDQDQVTLCARVIRQKLERVSAHVFEPDKLPIRSLNVVFNPPIKRNTNSMYYSTVGNKRPGRRLVKSVKTKEKENAKKRKILRVRTFGIGKKTGGVSAPPSGTTFKRAILRRKK